MYTLGQPHPAAMPTTIPEFKPDIPEYLLKDCSPAERYLIERVSVLDKKTDWQSTELVDQGNTQDQILVEARRTNGRISKLESDAIDAKAVATSQATDLKVLDFAVKLVSNKWFWVGLGVVVALALSFFGVLHLTPAALVKALVSLVAG